METTSFLAAARALLSEGETAKALQMLIAGVDNNPRFAGAERTLRVLESNFATARQQELKGILSFSEAQREFSRVVDATLAVIEDMEAGRVSPTPEAQKRNSVLVLAGLGALVLVVLAAFFFLKNRVRCPDFEQGKQMKILVLPFQNVGQARAKPEVILQNRIRELTRKNNLSAGVGILGNYDIDRENPDPAAASRLCLRCRADLVIWGQYSVATDSSRVAIQYKFVSDGREGSTEVLAFKDITALQGGQMVKGLDDVIFSICGMVALREQRWDLAKKWLGKVKEPDATDAAMLDWLAKNQR